MAENPLTKDDLQIINDSLQALDDAEEIIKRSEQAGFDMTERKERLATQRQHFIDVKRAFFPSRRGGTPRDT